MNYKDIDFLYMLNTRIRKEFGENFVISAVLESIKNGKLSLSNTSKYKIDLEDYDWMDEFRLVINRIRTIIADPRVHVKREKEILRSSVAKHVDQQGFNMTIKDSKLWKVDEIMTEFPEYVYANIPEDDLTIYENRFITSLINRMYEFISRGILKLYDEILNIQDKLGKNVESFFNFDILEADENTIDKIFINTLTPSDDPMVAILKNMILMKKRLIQLMGTVFYRNCMKAVPLPLPNVMLTNILIHDPDYRFCYMYSRKLLTFRLKSTETKIQQSAYANYVTIAIINEFYKHGYKYDNVISEAVRVVNGRMIFNKISLTKNNINILFTTIKRKLVIDVMLNYDSGHDIRDTNNKKRSLTIVDFITDSYSDQEYQILLQKNISAKFTNSIIVTSEMITTLDNVYTVSPNLKVSERHIEKLAKSLALIIEGSEFIYTVKCPVCGSKVVIAEEIMHGYECLVCGSFWSIFTPGQDNTSRELVWIKRFNP